MNAETLRKAASPQQAAAQAWRFDRFELDAARGVLRAGGAEVALRPKTFELLRYLVANPGRLIPKRELLDRVWVGVMVTEDSVVQCVGELRAALGDSAQRLIVTVPRRGYRLDAPVEAIVSGDFAWAAEHVAAAAVEPVAVVAAFGPAAAGTAPSPARPARRRARLTWAITSIVLLLGLAIALLARPPGADSGVDRGISARRALAVLPFADLSDPAAPALAEAVTQDLTAELARMANTLVFAGNAVRSSDAARDAGDLGRALGATHVVTGSVQRLAHEVVVRAQLARVGDAAVLWSERLRYGDNEWNWSQEIGPRIALALDERLSVEHRPGSGYAGRPQGAVDATLQGTYLLRHMRNRDDLLQARALFEQALAADPESAFALTDWALTHLNEINMRWSKDPKGQLALAADALERALRQRQDYAITHFAMSQVLFLRGQVDEAAQACERALALWPNEPLCLRRLGFYRLQQGRPADLVPPVELAMRLDPLDPIRMSFLHFYLGMAAFHQREDARAYASLEKAVAVHRQNAFAWGWMAAIDALHGRDEAAHRNLAEFQKIIPGQTVAGLEATETSTVPAFWAERKRLYEGLRKAGMPP